MAPTEPHRDEGTRVFARPIIDDAEAFTPTWLTQVLAEAGVDGTVSGLSLAPVGTGQLASCYRLALTYSAGTGPQTIIAKLPSTDPQTRQGSSMTYRTEVNFYNRLAPKLQIAIPRCYYAAMTPDAGSFTLLLEDMHPALPGDQIAGCSPANARAAATALAGLHAPSWCDPALDELDFLIPKISAYLDLTAEHMPAMAKAFIARRTLDALTTETLIRFADSFAAWGSARETPFSLIHNDFRLDNLLFAGAKETDAVTTVDWQSVSVGLPLRDLAYLLGPGLSPEDRRAAERDIVEHYRLTLEDLGVRNYGAAACWEDYRFGLFHGLYICLAADSLARDSERGNRMFSVMAERIAIAIDDHDSFSLL